jgi:drug/metabolite transporter (DMT)-like permease
MKLTARAKAYLALLAVSAIWGIAGPVIKGTLEYIPPFTFLYYRFLMVCVITIPWYILYLRRHPLEKKDIFLLTVFGYLATTVNLGLLFVGFERTTSLDGTLLGVVSPLFIVALGVLFLKEKINSHAKLGLGIAFIGSIVTVVQPLFEGHAFPLENVLGNVLILIGAIVWAVFTFFSKKSFKHFSPTLFTLHSAVVGLVSFAPLAFIENGYSLPPAGFIFSSPLIFFGVFYMSIVSFLVAFFLYEYGMSKIQISEGSIFTYLHPLFALPVAYFWLGEQITVAFAVGAILIAVGVVFAEKK